MENALLIGLGILLFMLPTLNAFSRKHHQAKAIFFLNAMLGWTVIGWIAALIWSWTAVERKE